MSALPFETALLAVALALTASCASEPEVPSSESLAPSGLRSIAEESSATAALTLPRRLAIDLPTALELAGGRNPEVMMARVAVERAENTTRRREFSLLPSVYPLFRAFSHEGQAQTQAASNVSVGRTNFELQALPAFQWDAGPILYHVLAAQQREGAARARLEVKRLDATFEAAAGYLDLVRAYTEVSIAQAAIEAAAALLHFVEARLRAGAAVRADELRAEAELARRDQDLARAVGHVARASARLVSVLLLDPDVELVPKENVPALIEIFSPDASALELIETARTRRPEVEEAGSELAARDAERDAVLLGPLIPFVAAPAPARAAYPPLLPTLLRDPSDEPSTTRAAYLPAFGQWGPGGPWAYGQFYGPDSPFGDTSRSGFFGPTLGSLNFSQDLVIYAGVRFGPGGIGDVPAYRRRALALQEQAIEIDRVGIDVQREISLAHAALVTAHARLESAREEVIAAEEADRLERDRFEKGASIQLDAIDADDMLVRAQSRELEAIVSYDMAQYRLLRAVGAPPR
jgi:outer membrane protein TolC